MKRFWPLAGLVIGVAAVVGLLWFALAPVEVERQGGAVAEGTEGVKYRPEGGVAESHSRSAARKGVDRRKAKKPSAAPQLATIPDWYAKLPSSADRELGKRLQDAQDADDRQATLAAAADARGSKSVEVRQAAVEALSMLETDALPLLKEYLTDASPEVAESAYDAWDTAVDGIEAEHERMAAVKEVLPLIRSDEKLDVAMEKFVALDQPRAIRELSAMAQKGDKRISEAARRAYESATGEPFESWAKAELKAMSYEDR